MIEFFNNINTGICSFLHINSYIQGVVVLLCINIIAILGMAVLTGFTRLFSFGSSSPWSSARPSRALSPSCWAL